MPGALLLIAARLLSFEGLNATQVLGYDICRATRLTRIVSCVYAKFPGQQDAFRRSSQPNHRGQQVHKGRVGRSDGREQ